MAEKVQKFLRETPKRFHSKPADLDTFVPTKASSPLKTTIPVTPEFEMDKLRTRPLPASALELEEKMLAEIKPFKAQPINPLIFESMGDYGVPRVEKKPTTMFQEFNLHATQREQKEAEEDTVEEFVFKARPAPSHIFESVVGVPEKRTVPLTVPESPAISKPTKKSVTPTLPEDVSFKAQPFPNMHQAYQPTLPHTATAVEPFQRMEQYQEPRVAREKLQKEEAQKMIQMREFHAQPLPDVSCVSRPVVDVKPITVPEPFELESERLHDKYQASWQEKMEKMTADEKVEFRAQEVMNVAPFVPKKSTKPLTEVSRATL